MKEWQVRYLLGEMLHSYVIEARNEAEAYEKVLRSIPETSKENLHELSVKRRYTEWN